MIHKLLNRIGNDLVADPEIYSFITELRARRRAGEEFVSRAKDRFPQIGEMSLVHSKDFLRWQKFFRIFGIKI